MRLPASVNRVWPKFFGLDPRAQGWLERVVPQPYAGVKSPPFLTTAWGFAGGRASGTRVPPGLLRWRSVALDPGNRLRHIAGSEATGTSLRIKRTRRSQLQLVLHVDLNKIM